jgi:hypothetical protein
MTLCPGSRRSLGVEGSVRVGVVLVSAAQADVGEVRHRGALTELAGEGVN